MKRPLLVLPALLLAGCVQAPPLATPEAALEVPGRFGDHAPPAAHAVEVDDRWWLDFGDATLDALVDEAMASNPDLLVGASRVRQAEAAARIAGASLSPTISAGLAGARRKQNFVGFPIPGGEDRVLSTVSTNFGVSLNVSWEADLWGRLGAEAREGVVAWQATRADYLAARNSIAGQVAKAWFAANEASRQAELAARTATSFERSTEQVRDRFEQGVRSSLDVRLALSQLASARAAVEASERQRDSVVRQLELLLARYPSAQLTVRTDRLLVPKQIPTGLPATLVARRPDLVAAERRLAAAGERYRVARASLYPRLALTASAGTSTDSLVDLLDGDFSVWSLLGNLTAPLLQGGRLRAGVDLAQAGIDEGVALWLGLTLRAYSEVETALAAETRLADQERWLEEAAAQAREAERQAVDRYRNGLVEYVTVLEAQRRTFDAERQLLTARRLRLDNRVDLYLALGGGFEADDALDLSAPVAGLPASESTPPQDNPR